MDLSSKVTKAAVSNLQHALKRSKSLVWNAKQEHRLISVGGKTSPAVDPPPRLCWLHTWGSFWAGLRLMKIISHLFFFFFFFFPMCESVLRVYEPGGWGFTQVLALDKIGFGFSTRVFLKLSSLAPVQVMTHKSCFHLLTFFPSENRKMFPSCVWFCASLEILLEQHL